MASQHTLLVALRFELEAGRPGTLCSSLDIFLGSKSCSCRSVFLSPSLCMCRASQDSGDPEQRRRAPGKRLSGSQAAISVTMTVKKPQLVAASNAKSRSLAIWSLDLPFLAVWLGAAPDTPHCLSPARLFSNPFSNPSVGGTIPQDHRVRGRGRWALACRFATADEIDLLMWIC